MKAHTILLVEDNPDDEALMMRALARGRLDGSIVVARDGVEALDYFFGTGIHEGRDPRDVPAITLLDLKLPRLSGLEVLRSVRADERTRLAPIVVLTTSDETRDIAESYALGANSYVRKPVAFDAFANAIETLGTYWLTLNQVPLGPG